MTARSFMLYQRVSFKFKEDIVFKEFFILFFVFINVCHGSNENWFLDFSDEYGGANVFKAMSVFQEKYYVRVAILEPGFVDVDHDYLKDNIYINSNEIPDNNIDDDGNGYVDDYRSYNSCLKDGSVLSPTDHATHVAGTVVSVFPNVEILPISVTANEEGCWDNIMASHYPDNLAHGINYAIDAGVDVINISLGFNNTSSELEAALERAYAHNVILVIAAGNDRAKLEGARRKEFPALYARDYSNIINVASSDLNISMSSFSNYSSDYVHVFAPGSNIYSSLAGNRFGNMSGTSMAAPVISGVVALVLATNGFSDISYMRERIMRTSRKFEDLSGKVYSSGLVDAYSAITGQLSLNFVWK